jgi:ACR3 family arsenite transporter
MNLLFLCTGNSCRSQIAEGWARHLGDAKVNVMSAGIEAHGKNPRAISVMAESGVDIAAQESTKLTDEMLTSADYLVTVCGHADEHCPTVPAGVQREHWPLPDPAKATGTEDEVMAVFRASRDDIRQRVGELLGRLQGDSHMSEVGERLSSMSVFERYLTLWVGLCIIGGIVLGKVAPGFAEALDGMAISVNGAPVVSIPIAVCLFLMMYPIMVKIDFHEVVRAGKSIRPVGLTLFINWAVKPFTMYAISSFFLGSLFLGFIGPEAVDLVKMPLGEKLAVGDTYGAGTVVMIDGMKMLEVPLWRSYLAGCILLGIAPCTAMVLVWGYLSKGNDGHTLVMVAINSLMMLLLFGFLGGFLLGVGRLPVPWEALLLSISIYVALPLVAGYLSRKWIIATRGEDWFREKFLHVLTPVTISALLLTLVLLFSLKGETIVQNPLTILWIAVPLFVQTVLIFAFGYGLAKLLKLCYADAAPTAMIGASNHFEVAIATAAMLYGLSSGAALATVVGVLIEVPLMLMLVRICLRTRDWFGPSRASATERVGT